MRVAVVAAALAAAARADPPSAQCQNITRWDPPGIMTNGNNFATYPNVTQDECQQMCCSAPQCVALSWDAPLPRVIGPCKIGESCCFLKDVITGVDNNTVGPWVHTAQVLQPPVPLPTPTPRQQRFMQGDWSADKQVIGSFTQFMHFSVTTFGNVEHNCVDGKCLPASLFNPTNVDPVQWVLTARAMGASEICLTAHHEGGFCLWPTLQQNYSVAQSPWKKDILAPFVAAAKQYGINICYYLGPNANGYLTQVLQVQPEDFVERQLNMTLEVLTQYGPVDRLWWDHYWGGCGGLSECPGGFPEAWPRFTNLVRTVSPDTIIGTGPDVDHSAGGESGTGSYPRWNTCNSSDPSGEAPCSAFGPIGSTFRPREADATIQNPGDAWFWHAGHAYWNASEIWDHFFLTWGRGDAFILNMPPNTTGVIPQEYVDEATKFGNALRQSFADAVVANTTSVPTPCASAELTVDIPAGSTVNAFLTREVLNDATINGQRIANYTIEVLDASSGQWQPLPPVNENTNIGLHGITVGYRIVDFAPFSISGTSVRVRCLASVQDPVLFRDFGAYLATPPQ